MLGITLGLLIIRDIKHPCTTVQGLSLYPVYTVIIAFVRFDAGGVVIAAFGVRLVWCEVLPTHIRAHQFAIINIIGEITVNLVPTVCPSLAFHGSTLSAGD